MAMIWLNRAGGLTEASAAGLPVHDRGLLVGDGLFETIRVYTGQVPLLSRHLARLARSAAALGFGPLPGGLPEAVAAVVAANAVADGVVRITLTRGPGPRGFDPPASPSPTLLITAQPASPPAAPVWQLAVSAIRANPTSPAWRHKTISGLEKVMARAGAAAAGADEALLLNTEGCLAECAAANLFWVRDGRVETPDLACGCLPGVIRSLIVELGLPPVVTGAFPAHVLGEATEVFATNAWVQVAAVSAVSGLEAGPLTWPAPGPVTRRIAAALREQFGLA